MIIPGIKSLFAIERPGAGHMSGHHEAARRTGLAGASITGMRAVSDKSCRYGRVCVANRSQDSKQTDLLDTRISRNPHHSNFSCTVCRLLFDGGDNAFVMVHIRHGPQRADVAPGETSWRVTDIEYGRVCSGRESLRPRWSTSIRSFKGVRLSGHTPRHQ